MCIQYKKENILPLQVKNKPHVKGYEHAFILGSMDSTIAKRDKYRQLNGNLYKYINKIYKIIYYVVLKKAGSSKLINFCVLVG